MPRVVEFVRSSPKRVTVLVRDDGVTTANMGFTASNPTQRAAVCRLLRCDDLSLLAWLDGLASAVTGSFTVSPPAATVAAGTYTIREFEASSGGDHVLSPAQVCVDLLPTVPVDRLLVWGSLDALACLDIDYHGVTPPRRDLLESWVSDRIAPKPLAWHFSRGGGLHLFYSASPPFTAEMLAAAAAVRFRTIDPTAGIELKRQVRGPGSERVHHAPGGQDTKGSLSSWIGADTPDEEAVADWLAANDIELGRRYDHSRCPIDPKAATSATGDPVTFGEHGAYCHRCAGHGVAIGSRKPGFAPWSSLCGSPSSGDVGRMVRNMAHWGHAGVVLREKYGIPENIARLAYTCALTAYHDGDERIPMVFHPDTAKLTRCNDSWMNLQSGTTYVGSTLTPILAALPTAMASCEGKLKPIASTVAYLNQPHDLSDRGYPNVRIVNGYALSRQFLPPTAAEPALIPVIAGGAPKYVPASRRMPLDAAESTLNTIFPGIDWRCIRVLMCASGVAQETKLGLHPLLFVTGGTSTAKTMHVKIAAAILGSRSTAITYTADESRLKQAVKEGGQTSCIVQADEFLKEARRQMKRPDPRAALECLLTITPDTACHVLYQGSRKLGAIPALVLTETKCPPQVREYQQIARRLRIIKLWGEKKWEESIAAAGVRGESIHLLRAVSGDVAEACDVIMSDVIDRFFSVPMTWDAMADSLGALRISVSPDFEDMNALRLEFFRLVCELPDPPLRKQFPKEKGWKRIDKAEETPVREVYDVFADAAMGAGWCRSEPLTEPDWGSLLGVDGPVEIELKPDGASGVFVRFYMGKSATPYRVNGGIKTLSNPEVPT